MIGRLWRGEIDLYKAFWLYGVLGLVLLGLVSGFMVDRLARSGATPAVVFFSFVVVAFSLGYLVLVAVGIWRSAPNHDSPRAWSHAARAVVVLVVLSEVVAMLLAAYSLTEESSDPGTNSCNIEATLRQAPDYPMVGFYRGDCADNFGLAIAPAENGLYSVTFCGPGGCFKPGSYRANTRLTGDPAYRVIDGDVIEVRGRDGFSRYRRCPVARQRVCLLAETPVQ
ncbi:MAG: hypothetical protein IPJ21_11610 [Sterolibacteriaceae bacterium]|nr:hypothetical protein [Sterolibacteriaceae bacterium]MBK9084503.1 hypothetical protein [Sterolibacteriaceae bacterium]